MPLTLGIVEGVLLFKPGFYLVRESDARRFFVSRNVSQKALERTAGLTLSNANGWEYWIDRCLGLDVDGNVAWLNLDCTDSFI